jgi:HEPN domain-containing protein
MDRTEEYTSWLDLAETDPGSARFLTGMSPRPLEIICFHCRQAAEKYLKACLVFHGTVFEKTHNLVVLLKECIKLDAKFEALKVECARLNVYGVEVRYPSHLSIDDADTGIALNDAETTRDLALLLLAPDRAYRRGKGNSPEPPVKRALYNRVVAKLSSTAGRNLKGMRGLDFSPEKAGFEMKLLEKQQVK